MKNCFNSKFTYIKFNIKVKIQVMLFLQYGKLGDLLQGHSL